MKKLGKHDFSGSCMPNSPYNASSQLTFSVGIFEWIAKKNGNELKKSKVKVRVKGLSSKPSAVYEKAKEIIAALDAGTYKGPQNITV